MASYWINSEVEPTTWLRSLSRLRGRAGVGVSPQSVPVEWRHLPPPAALYERVDLPRKRER